MIFVAVATEPTVFVMLTEADLRTLRTGRTLNVAPHQSGGLTFDKVVLSLHRDEADALALLRETGRPVGPLYDAEPPPGETKCERCRGIMPPWQLHEGRCIVCWCEEALALSAKAN